MLSYLSHVAKNQSLGFLTRYDTNWALQPQKMARDLKLWGYGKMPLGKSLHLSFFPNFLNNNTQTLMLDHLFKYEPRCEKTNLQGFQPGLTQTGLYNQRTWIQA